MFRPILILALAGLSACLRSDAFARIAKSHIDSKGQLWAVLVAGSNGWDNYRHQADICHSYQILSSHGIPDERIIVMMYDDIAQNENNPTPGIIINHPDGIDVYHDVPHDYTEDNVTPDNFISVLQGDEKKLRSVGSGKVLKSGPNDHVFVYFADHGAPGLIAFPDLSTGEEQVLEARKLMKALKQMHKQKKFKKMVIYVEACESGSMFYQLLPKNIDIYATTAANPEESSYATYFDEKRETYLGDLYSVKWMEDSDKENLTKETLQEQFVIVKNETDESHVQEYGDLSIGQMPVGEFQGRKETRPIIYKPVPRDSVPSRDVPLEILRRKLMASDGEEKYKVGKKLKKLLRNRAFADHVMNHLVTAITGNDVRGYHMLTKKQELNNFDCYEDSVQHFHEECFHLNKNPYILGKLYVLVNLCETGFSVEKIKNTMEGVCTHPPVYEIV